MALRGFARLALGLFGGALISLLRLALDLFGTELQELVAGALQRGFGSLACGLEAGFGFG